MSSLPSSSASQPYAHPWRTARNHSVLDTLFLFLLSAVAFSLPLEGVLISEGSRTFTFYFSILAAGVAVLRLPYLIRNLLRTPPLLVYIGVFVLGIILYFIRPFRGSSEINLLFQLIIMSCMFIYVADQPRARQQILWVYWFGWTLFVIVSMIEVLGGGATDTVLQQSSDVVRLKILNYSIGNHSGQVGAGLVMALSLAMTTRRLWLRLAVIASITAGSLTLFFGGTRGALLGVVATTALWLIIDRFSAVRSKKPLDRNSTSKAVTMIIIVIAVFIVLTQTQIGIEMLDSMGTRLDQTIESGDVSSRDIIFEAAVSIFNDYPMGVGYGNAQALIGRRLHGLERDPHNHALRMFIETGVIGGSLFILSLAFITRRGLKWYLRSQENFLFPMIFLFFYAATLAAFNYKITWFFVTMNALTPLDNPEYQAELEAQEAESP